MTTLSELEVPYRNAAKPAEAALADQAVLAVRDVRVYEQVNDREIVHGISFELIMTADPAPGRSPVLQVTDLDVHYGARRHRRQVLHGVTLEVSRGETIGVIGETGSGKSTLARTVLCIGD